jgi:hypothetical protein
LDAGSAHHVGIASGAAARLPYDRDGAAFDHALVEGRAVWRLVTDPAGGVAVGDVLQVTVYESEDAIVPGNFVTLPAQTVDCAGTISVPYAGQIRVAERTLSEIRREIEARLAIRVVAPRVAVELLQSGWPSNCPASYETVI